MGVAFEDCVQSSPVDEGRRGTQNCRSLARLRVKLRQSCLARSGDPHFKKFGLKFVEETKPPP